MSALWPSDSSWLTLISVEFYFNDSNLPFDKFLWTLTRKDPEGFVPIATLASFKRMQPIKDAIGLPKIAEVLRSSEFLEVSEDGERVKRRKPLVPVKDAFARSVYAKGFPEEHETAAAGARDVLCPVRKDQLGQDEEGRQEQAEVQGQRLCRVCESEDMDKFLATAGAGEKKEGEEAAKSRVSSLVMNPLSSCPSELLHCVPHILSLA
ncbi:hypothetical protein L7F22_052078 [Adiantum nelumboides]|nr:hypothetical protein [Adiantum nelumboides]